ncbi:hypothetical protein BAC1_00529 [uncultured bacterium]|nr:hypothetical protein BAC1_00529 [uncultured bacterium]
MPFSTFRDGDIINSSVIAATALEINLRQL